MRYDRGSEIFLFWLCHHYDAFTRNLHKQIISNHTYIILWYTALLDNFLLKNTDIAENKLLWYGMIFI